MDSIDDSWLVNRDDVRERLGPFVAYRLGDVRAWRLELPHVSPPRLRLVCEYGEGDDACEIELRLDGVEQFSPPDDAWSLTECWVVREGDGATWSAHEESGAFRCRFRRGEVTPLGSLGRSESNTVAGGLDRALEDLLSHADADPARVPDVRGRLRSISAWWVARDVGIGLSPAVAEVLLAVDGAEQRLVLGGATELSLPPIARVASRCVSVVFQDVRSRGYERIAGALSVAGTRLCWFERACVVAST